MPRKRKGADLSRNTSNSIRLRHRRSERTEEQTQQQNNDARVRMAQLRQLESEDTRDERNAVIRLERRLSRRYRVNKRRINEQKAAAGFEENGTPNNRGKSNLPPSFQQNSIFRGIYDSGDMAYWKSSSQPLEKIDRVMKNLELTTNELTNFDPELSKRERRKLEVRLNSDKGKPLQGHNENGIIIGTDKDLCDCLNEECPGCHLPCWTCRSCKCGFECRNDRKFIVESIEDEADGTVTINPVLR